MGLFDFLKRKPGGTTVGNLFRGVAKAASGGILGNGTLMITQEEADKRDLNEVDYYAKYGTTKDNAPPSDTVKKALGLGEYAKSALDAAAKSALDAAAKAVGQKLGSEVKQGAWELFKIWFKKNWWMVALPGGLVIGLLSWIIFRKKKTRKRW